MRVELTLPRDKKKKSKILKVSNTTFKEIHLIHELKIMEDGVAKNVSTKEFQDKLKSSVSEDDVILTFTQYFKLNKARMKESRIDLLLPNILFEFKHNENFKNNIDSQAKTLAQALTYARKIQDGEIELDKIPPSICIVDNNESFIVKTNDYKDFISNDSFSWQTPSNPDESLVKELITAIKQKPIKIYNIQDESKIGDLIDFKKAFIDAIKGSTTVALKKKITSENFQSVFEIWNKSVGEKTLKNQLKKEVSFDGNLAPYFIADLSQKSIISNSSSNKLHLTMDEKNFTEYVVNSDYYNFWNKWEKPSRSELEIIHRLRDRIYPEGKRRESGAFYTDPSVSHKVYEYLKSVYGENFHKEYKIWDMCAGSGNLELGLPSDSCLFLSTLDSREISDLNKLFPSALAFQFDFVNGEYGQLPQKLRLELENPQNKWIVLMNPAYATSRSGMKKDSKMIEIDGTDVGVFTSSVAKKEMEFEGIKKGCNEAINQFLYRSFKWVKYNLQIAILSKPKFITDEESRHFRDMYMNIEFKKGFIISSETFDGTKGKFPISFSIFNSSKKIQLTSQSLIFDIFQHEVIQHKNTYREIRLHLVGQKEIKPQSSFKPLNKWVDRPKMTNNNSSTCPPLNSFNGLYTGKIELDKKINGSFGYLMTTGNDLSQQNLTMIFTSAYGGGHGWFINSSNFEQSMVVYATRRIPIQSYINDKDQFCEPSKPLTKDFILRCVLYSLVHGSNQSSSIEKILYKGDVYKITNEFFPFKKDEVLSWEFSKEKESEDLVYAINKDTDRFLAKYLEANKQHLDEKSIKLLDKVREIYKYFFNHKNSFEVSDSLEINSWDLGFIQIKKALEETKRTDSDRMLEELSALVKELSKEILIQLGSFGLIQDGIVSYDEQLVNEIKNKKNSKKEEVAKNQETVISEIEESIEENEMLLKISLL